MEYILFLVIEKYVDKVPYIYYKRKHFEFLNIIKLRLVSKALKNFIDSDFIQNKFYDNLISCSIHVTQKRNNKIKTLLEKYCCDSSNSNIILQDIERLFEFSFVKNKKKKLTTHITGFNITYLDKENKIKSFEIYQGYTTNKFPLIQRYFYSIILNDVLTCDPKFDEIENYLKLKQIKMEPINFDPNNKIIERTKIINNQLMFRLTINSIKEFLEEEPKQLKFMIHKYWYYSIFECENIYYLSKNENIHKYENLENILLSRRNIYIDFLNNNIAYQK